MLWKLTGIFALTAVLILLVVPIRTHAVTYDPTSRSWVSPWNFLTSLYMTTPRAALILAFLIVAIFAAVKVIRGQW